jgi:hypothetical protein
MGQEWSADTPFQYFTDLEPDLGRLVTAGRRLEFAAFPEFSDESARDRIPDPQSASTLGASRLNWAEPNAPDHGAVLALYRALLALRLDHPALGASHETAGDAEAPNEGSLVIRRAEQGEVFWVAAQMKGRGSIDLARLAEARGEPEALDRRAPLRDRPGTRPDRFATGRTRGPFHAPRCRDLPQDIALVPRRLDHQPTRT